MANIKLTANEDNFVKAMEKASGAVGKLNAELSVNLARSFREADFIANTFAKGLGRLQKETEEAAKKAAQMRDAYVQSFRDMGDKMQSVGQNMSTYITLPLTLLAGASLKAYGELDSLKKGLTTIEGTSANVEKRLVQLREAAKLPGLGFQEAIQGDVRLRSVGIAAETSLRILKEFGNAAALTGGGKSELSQIITQLTQMAAKGKVAAQDLKPIIEAAPSVATAIKTMFGTVDSEGIQKQLAAAGKSSSDFINDLLGALEKTPRVAGGFKNAMENIGDSLFRFAAGIGESLDKSFDLSGKLNALSDKLAGLTEWFKGLSPEIQKTIFVVGGVVAVVGPLLIAIGGIIALSGPVIAAIAGISLPMVAVGAIIVSFTATVVRNWDMIKEVVTDTLIWDGLVNVVSFAASAVGEIFGLLFEAVSGDWSSFGDRLVNIGKRVYNTLIEVLHMFVNESLNLLQSFFGLFGGTNFMTRGIESVKMGLGSLTSKIMADVPKSTDYLKKLGDAIGKITNTKTTTGGGGLEVGKPDDRSQFQIEEDVKKAVDNIIKEWERARDVLGKINLKTTISPEVKGLQLITDPSYYAKKISWADEMLAAGKRLTAEMPKILSQIDLSKAGLTIEEQIRKNVTDRAITSLNEFNVKVHESVMQLQQTLIVDFASGIGEAIGSALGGNGFGFEKVFQNILQTIGNFMISLGKQMLTADRLIKIAKDLFGTEPGTGAIIALIAGGGLLKGLAGSLFSQTPKFAQGGMVTGPTFAMMGDNASGREMALPWEKTSVFAQAIAANMNGGGSGELGNYQIQIKGEDMFLIIERFKRRNGN
jgi:tape measure domain-containing protein